MAGSWSQTLLHWPLKCYCRPRKALVLTDKFTVSLVFCVVQKGWTPGLGRGQICRAMWRKARLKLSSTLPSFQFQPQFLPLALQPSSPDTQGLHLTQVQTGVLLRAVRWCLRAQFNILCPAAPASRCGPRITEFTPPQPGSFHSPLRPRSVSLPFTRLLDLTTMLSYNKNPFFCQNKSFRKGTYAAWF